MDKKFIEIYIHQHIGKDAIPLKVAEDATVQDLLDAAQQAGLISDPATEEIHVFAEDDDKPLKRLEKLSARGIKHKHHIHCHRCHEIRVSVSYNGDKQQHEFTPATKIRRIRHWALQEFGLTGKDATDKVLRLLDGTEIIDLDTHLGSYVQHPSCHIEFNLTVAVAVAG